MSQGTLSFIDEERLAEITGAHRTTIRRWKKRGRLARWLEQLVRVIFRGELDEVDRAWRGWIIRNGELISPEGWTFTPGAVRAGRLWRSRAMELGAMNRHARIELDDDEDNNADIDRLAAVQRALTQATEAFEEIANRLTAGERNRLYCRSPGMPPSTPGGPRILGSFSAQNGVGSRLLFQLVDSQMSTLHGPQYLVELAAHPHGEAASGEGGADQSHDDAFGETHSRDSR